MVYLSALSSLCSLSFTF